MRDMKCHGYNMFFLCFLFFFWREGDFPTEAKNKVGRQTAAEESDDSAHGNQFRNDRSDIGNLSPS